MFQIEKSFEFEAAHRLPYHDGKCAELHGHSYMLTIVLEAVALQDKGPQCGMVVDFRVINDAVKPLIDKYLDHKHLNSLLSNPTAEEIARWVFEEVEEALPQLLYVQVQETNSCRVRYYGHSQR